jgi:hypothetical protein
MMGADQPGHAHHSFGSQPLLHSAPASSHSVYGHMPSQFTVGSSTAAVPPSPASQFNQSHASGSVASFGAQPQQHPSPAAARDAYGSMPLQFQTQHMVGSAPLASSAHSPSFHHAEMAPSHASQPSASSAWSSHPQHHMAPAVPHPVYGQMHAPFAAASSSAAMAPAPALLQSNASTAWGSGALSGAPQHAAGVPSPAAARDAYGHMPMQFQTQHVAGSAPLATSAHSLQHSPPPQLALQSATSNAWASATFHSPPAPALQPAQSNAWGTVAFAAAPTMHQGAAAGQRQ